MLTIQEWERFIRLMDEDIEKKDFGLFGFSNIRRYVDCPVCKFSNNIEKNGSERNDT